MDAKAILQADLAYLEAVNDNRELIDLTVNDDRTRKDSSSINLNEIVIEQIQYMGETYYFDKSGNVINENAKLVGIKKDGHIYMFNDDLCNK